MVASSSLCEPHEPLWAPPHPAAFKRWVGRAHLLLGVLFLSGYGGAEDGKLIYIYTLYYIIYKYHIIYIYAHDLRILHNMAGFFISLTSSVGEIFRVVIPSCARY